MSSVESLVERENVDVLPAARTVDLSVRRLPVEPRGRYSPRAPLLFRRTYRRFASFCSRLFVVPNLSDGAMPLDCRLSGCSSAP